MSQPSPAQPFILVVEDDEPTRLLFRETLADEGFSSVLASNGQQALGFASRERPDLIILDLAMPGHDGFSLLDALRQHAELRTVPVLVVSAMPAIEDELPGQAFVRKPFDLSQLLEEVHRLLAA